MSAWNADFREEKAVPKPPFSSVANAWSKPFVGSKSIDFSISTDHSQLGASSTWDSPFAQTKGVLKHPFSATAPAGGLSDRADCWSSRSAKDAKDEEDDGCQTLEELERLGVQALTGGLLPEHPMADPANKSPSRLDTFKRAVQRADSTDSSSAAERGDVSDSQLTHHFSRWIETVISQRGGRILSTNLGSALAKANAGWFRLLKQRFGGLATLLRQWPSSRLLLEEDGHISLHPLPNLPDPHLPNADEALEAVAIEFVVQALRYAPDQTLLAVELANTLRSRMGAEVLTSIRMRHGGLLTMLEAHPSVEVVRVPKQDCVRLRPEYVGWLPPSGSAVSRRLAPPKKTAIDDAIREKKENIAARGIRVEELHANVTDAQLIAAFSTYGDVESVRVLQKRGSYFGFVNFATVEQAEEARRVLGNTVLWTSL